MQINLITIYNWMDDFGITKYRLDDPSYIRMIKLMDLTNQIARSGNSTRRSIWINVPSDQPEGEWINIVFRGDCYDVGDVFYDIEIDGVQMLSYDSKRSEGDTLDVTEMLDWLMECVSKVITMAQNDEYDSYISKVPYYKRRGVICRKDYYSIVPLAREKYLSGLTKNEIEELLDCKGTAGTYEDSMTARRFYEACAVVYRELGIENVDATGFNGWADSEEERTRYGGITPKEWYYAASDGRDDGLYALPLDDSTAFAGWIRHKEPYYSYEYYGGHPWDIIRKYCYSLSLYVDPEIGSDRCKLVVAGDSADKSTEIVRAFLALKRAGYAVDLRDFKTLTDRLLEKDYLAVVEEVEPSRHGNTIAGHFARDEISLLQIEDQGIVDKLIQATEWEKLDEVRVNL
ncbi:MAG: hypothetical protein J6I68_00985 [Butyrivibrio sp.]|uniref:hypothetical protein n=1 Tax=Butyrivibrio sp. TaxID=28121 RepID=UPI001B2106E8|nr:hypothetical protein [Butyrivibrio sp.]MBO6252136.1 hypothetical protein [Bacteroidaceae bacterium]MBP3781802.1 hypothetical protein [Butyrivibrio sp.]